MNGRISRRITVRGRVQGVAYRDWTIGKARALGLSGWVRNRRDGSVEILAAGDEDALVRLAGLCRHGPPAARVEAVTAEDADEAVPDGFELRATA